MAVNIYLRSSGKTMCADSFSEVEVMRCVRDFQHSLGLASDQDLTKLVRFDGVGTNPSIFIEELANECETQILVDKSKAKWSILWDALKRMHSISSPLPTDTARQHYIENPLYTSSTKRFGDWLFDQDGIRYTQGKGCFIPRKWLLVFSPEYLEKYLRRELSPSGAGDKLEAPILLLMLEEELYLLNSRSSKDRSQEIRRKLDNLSKVMRTVMEECEDDE